MSVKRYEPEVNSDMLEYPSGNYVSYEDYAKLLSVLKELLESQTEYDDAVTRSTRPKIEEAFERISEANLIARLQITP